MYFFEYIKHREWAAIASAFLYMFTKKSYANGKQMNSSMGIFATRKGTLDFQYINYAYEIEIKHFIEKHTFEGHVWANIAFGWAIKDILA
jgi:hypothetical protein